MPVQRPASRHELLRLGRRLTYAERAVALLERHRDGLLYEFVALLEQRRTRRARLAVEYAAARRVAVVALMREGEITLHSTAATRARRPELLVVEWSLRTVSVPMFLSRDVRSRPDERGYGVVGTDALIDALASAHEALLETVIRVAEIDAVLHRLATKIGEVIRRINVLRHRLIPALETERRRIRFQLDEREREERTYQRMAKRHRERHRSERAARERERTQSRARGRDRGTERQRDRGPGMERQRDREGERDET